MRYGIVAIGSRGDVQPYIALALGLMDHGHTAIILAHENFKNFVEGYGVGFHPLDGSIEHLLNTEEGLAMLRSGKLMAFLTYLQKTILRTQEKVNEDLVAGCRQVDVIVTSLLGIPWVDAIAEKLQKPWAIVQLNLPTTRTAAFPVDALAFFHFPAFNKLTYWLLDVFHWKHNRKPVNDFRKVLGLAPLHASVLKKVSDEKILNLHCFSPALRGRPSDWEPHTDIMGFLFLPEDKRTANPQEKTSLEFSRWLDAGTAPIYIGFGSIPIPDTRKITDILTELLHDTRHRFIFCQGWSMPLEIPSHPRLFQLGSINHEWLFPRCRTAIIHGGIGTTAAVLKAKIPVIVVSIIADQPWWGKIIEDQGVGIHIQFRKLSYEKLLSAINHTDNPSMRRQALHLGARINAESGLNKTVEALEIYFRNWKATVHQQLITRH